ncbi:Na+/H+ antiporter NhaC, partial [Photobacterium sanctipauli]
MVEKKNNINRSLGLIPILAMVFLLVVGYGQLKLPVEFIMMASAAVACTVAWFQGYKWKEIMGAITKKIAETLPANFILILVGAMIGAWMAGGTIPMIVYYGLKIISPDYLLVTAFVVTSLVSICTGTSWGSVGTIGVALMGIAAGMGAPLPAVAGAVISGAYFGDKMSPLSDSTNMASIVTGTDIYDHIRHMLWTTIPSALLALVVFLFAGFQLDIASSGSEKVDAMLASIEQLFNMNLFLLIPPLLVLGGAIKKFPPIPCMAIAAFLGIFNAIVFQGFDIKTSVDAMMTGFNTAMFGLTEAVNADVAKLVNRGGMVKMMRLTLFAFCAFSFASVTGLCGGMDLMMEKMAKRIKSVGGLICSTMATAISVQLVTAEGKLPLIVTAELMGGMYKKFDLCSKNLSRTLEDAGTVIGPLIPWSQGAIFMSGTLGVAVLDYLP